VAGHILALGRQAFRAYGMQSPGSRAFLISLLARVGCFPFLAPARVPHASWIDIFDSGPRSSIVDPGSVPAFHSPG